MSMERFTKKVDGMWTALCNYGKSPFPIVTQEIIDRLAAYEDTGFTPEEVQQMRWIPVEGRLPEEKQRVIVRCERVGTSVGWILWGRWMTDIGPHAGDVTHWMLLPAPPDHRPEEGEDA